MFPRLEDKRVQNTKMSNSLLQRWEIFEEKMRFKNSKSVLMSFPNGKQKSPISFESVFNFGSDRKFVTKLVFRLILTFLLRKVSSTVLCNNQLKYRKKCNYRIYFIEIGHWFPQKGCNRRFLNIFYFWNEIHAFSTF